MRVVRTLLVSGVAAMALGVGAGTASAATNTLHFFGVGVRFQFMTPEGRVLGPNDLPVAGDKVIAEARLFAGNHLSHSSTQTGVAHLFCTFTNDEGVASCMAVVKVADMGTLTGSDVTVDFAVEGALIIPLDGGTGAFAGTNAGSVKVERINDSNFDDFTIVYTT